MAGSFEIEAENRSEQGRCASRRMRKTGRVPSVVYGGAAPPAMVSIDHNELMKHLEHEAFYSHILNLSLNGVVENVVLKDLQRHPARPVVLHVDFQRISADKAIRMLVPLRFVNEDKCPGIKKGGTATRSVTEVEVICLPKDLPEFITVDMGTLEMSHTVHISDLIMPQGVVLYHVIDPKSPVVSIHGSRGDTETQPAAAASKA